MGGGSELDVAGTDGDRSQGTQDTAVVVDPMVPHVTAAEAAVAWSRPGDVDRRRCRRTKIHTNRLTTSRAARIDEEAIAAVVVSDAEEFERFSVFAYTVITDTNTLQSSQELTTISLKNRHHTVIIKM